MPRGAWDWWIAWGRGRPTVLDRRTVERILLLTTERVPVEATHWSTRLMARYAGVTQWQVRQFWRAADFKPHWLKTFKLSRDPQFAEKVIDVVGLYLSPPDNVLVLSVDEKTQIQALDRTHPLLPLRPRAGRVPHPGHPDRCVASCEFTHGRLGLGEGGRPMYPFAEEPREAWRGRVMHLLPRYSNEGGRAVVALGT